MSRDLRVFRVDEGRTEEVGTLIAGEVTIGREKEDAEIVINSQGVSRRHGVFTKVKQWWLFQDLESTNGSWWNGKKLSAGEWFPIRPGDILQMADTAVRFVSTGGTSADQHSLLVFRGDEALIEYPVSASGRALVIGGPDNEVKGISSPTSLVFEKREGTFVVFTPGQKASFLVNGVETNSRTELHDGDQILFLDLRIFVNFPSPQQLSFTAATAQSVDTAIADVRRVLQASSTAIPKPVPRRTVFGKGSGGEEIQPADTIALAPEEIRKRLTSSMFESPAQSKRYGIFEIGLIGVTIICLILTFVLLVYWLVSG
jgi:pSer/pThr/pTyr-binding forkhead associated (FHA) protein